MLRQQTEETPTLPAAQARVTPEELAQALSRIEARKDAGQRNVDGTISIGEAVQQLGVDSTPEEVLAEVQAIRQEPMRTQKRRPSLTARLVLALGLGGILLGLGLGENSLSQMRSHQAALSQMRSHQAAKPASFSNAAFVPSNALKPISLDPNLLVNTASNKLVMLSEVGDNQPVQCVYSDGSFQPYTTEGGRPGWDLIKRDGQVYVQGWMPQMSHQALQKDGARFSTWSYPSYIPVTLSLKGFEVMPGVGNDTEFHAVNIHLDKYAHEKWQP